MRTSLHGIHLLEFFEGYFPRQYDDGTGVMTIGFGTTEADISPLPSYMSEATAEHFLIEHLHSKYEPAVNAVNPPTQNAFDALVSAAYNLGPGSMAWDVGRDVKAGNLHAAAKALLAYDHAGGVRMLGLTRRREAEAALLVKPDAPAVDYSIFAGNERHVVELFDRLYPHRHLHAHTLRRLHVELVALRKAVWLAHVHGNPPGWQMRNRGLRWQELNRRTQLSV